MRRRSLQVVDLGFGDSGKGTMVDYLVRRHDGDLVVRFNGGPQAGHNVVLPDGRHHTFSQFGSGSFVPEVRTLLSRFMLIEPYAMLNEADHLASVGVADVLPRTLIDERCSVITPPQQIANRIRERARGNNAHGTCGLGIGQCMADSIEHPELTVRAADLADRAVTGRKLKAGLEYTRSSLDPLRSAAMPQELRVLDDPDWIEVALDVYARVATEAVIATPARAQEVLREATCTVYEGAQGVLLDERFGFHPHTTWSKTTFTNADALCDEAQSDAERHRVGVLRTYMTRHGAGPFVSYDDPLQESLSEPHNVDDGWQGKFRRGVLDLVMLRYSLAACGGVDSLAITHLDRISKLPTMVCDAYHLDGALCTTLPFDPKRVPDALEESVRSLSRARPRLSDWPVHDAAALLDRIQEELKTPVEYRSAGPTYRDKR